MNSLDTLKNVFADTLALPLDGDIESLQYRENPEWDSVAHVQLINAMERAFDVMLETNEVLDMSSFTKAREILTTHGIVFDA